MATEAFVELRPSDEMTATGHLANGSYTTRDHESLRLAQAIAQQMKDFVAQRDNKLRNEDSSSQERWAAVATVAAHIRANREDFLSALRLVEADAPDFCSTFRSFFKNELQL